MAETVFVERDSLGRVKGWSAAPREGISTEEIASDHPDVVLFQARLNRIAHLYRALKESDQ